MRGLLISCACALGLGISAYAHHSMNGFDRNKNVTLVGVVKQFKWANPHSWIEMDVANPKGVVETWNLEMTAPGILVRAGWKSNIIKPGDKITVTAHPLVSGEIGGQFVSLILPDGTVLTERGSQPAVPAAKQ
jgi:hypothetical protein